MKNKYESLIEAIINDNDKEAKALFHQIVVEKSRDIYESLMDEEVGGNQATGMVDDITKEVQQDDQGIGEDDEEFGDEPSMDGDDDLGDDDLGDDDLGGDELGGDDLGGDDIGDELGGDEGDMGGEEGSVEAAISSIESQLADLKDMLGAEGGESDLDGDDLGSEMGDGAEGTPPEGMDDLDGAGDEGGEFDSGADDEFGSEETFGESKSASGSGKKGSGNPFAKKSGSGKSGSGKSGSGKAKSGSGKAKSGSGKAKTESYRKTDVEIMKEYVDKIGEIYKQEPAQGEGKTVGTGGDAPTVNKKSISRTSGPDFGGTSQNIVKGGSETAADGKQFSAPNNEYTKKRGELPGAGKFKNVPGLKKNDLEKEGKPYEKSKDTEGKTVGTGGDAPSINDKPLLKHIGK